MHDAATLVHVDKFYLLTGETVRALQDVTFTVPQGEFLAIMGASGSGKSTLLNLLGCLDRPTHGKLLLDGHDVSEMTDDELSEIRAGKIGFIFQAYNLIPQLTVLENIEVPLYYMNQISAQTRKRCRELAEMVGLGDRLNHRSYQLSGGQQQRVGIARSLVNDPTFILADEPTGNLDTTTTSEIMELLKTFNRQGKTIIIVTHEPEVGLQANRIIRLRDGRIQDDTKSCDMEAGIE